jgi:hypothetical protein
MTGERTFTITFVPRGGIDGVKAVRRLLKYAGRYLGLRATDVREERTEERQTRNTEHFGAVLELIVSAGKGECDV